MNGGIPPPLWYNCRSSFSSDLLNTNEDIAPQSQALQAFVLWQEGGGGGEGRATNFVSLRSFIRIKSINLDKVDIHRTV